ncbi:MAG: hypothetical protein JXA21_29250 [Anaerolineae bacterium]|nr:hypothetical protein [Anaerolineae bacterium]
MQKCGFALLSVLLLAAAFAGIAGGAPLPEMAAPMPTWTRVAPPPVTPTPTAAAAAPTSPSPEPSLTLTPSAPSSLPRDGAALWLRVKSASGKVLAADSWPSLWTTVQWQDAFGDWHTVEGWSGPLDDVAMGEGRKVWWLPASMSGAGPFRWQIYRTPQGPRLAESDPFFLPEADTFLYVDLSLP